MMHPMRVQWSVPDDERRRAARDQFQRDRDDRVARPLDQFLASVSGQPDIAKRYPDLHATITHFGTLLSVRYVPEQWAMSVPNPETFHSVSRPVKMTNSKWVALVATEAGTIEMDALGLQVMWPMASGDPIGGIVSASELERQLRG